jgi:hypothetical protein
LRLGLFQSRHAHFETSRRREVHGAAGWFECAADARPRLAVTAVDEASLAERRCGGGCSSFHGEMIVGSGGVRNCFPRQPTGIRSPHFGPRQIRFPVVLV